MTDDNPYRPSEVLEPSERDVRFRELCCLLGTPTLGALIARPMAWCDWCIDKQHVLMQDGSYENHVLSATIGMTVMFGLLGAVLWLIQRQPTE